MTVTFRASQTGTYTGVNSIACSVPPSTVAGDLLVLMLTGEDSTNTFTAAGWTQQALINDATGLVSWVASRVAQVGDAGSTVTVAGAKMDYGSYVLASFQGASGLDGAVAHNTYSQAGTYYAPSVTAGSKDAWLTLFVLTGVPSTLSPPYGFTQLALDTENSGAHPQASWYGYQMLAAPGATGTATFYSTPAENAYAVSLLLTDGTPITGAGSLSLSGSGSMTPGSQPITGAATITLTATGAAAQGAAAATGTATLSLSAQGSANASPTGAAFITVTAAGTMRKGVYSFQTPTALVVPPVAAGENDDPLAVRLFGHYHNRPQGYAVVKYGDGTYSPYPGVLNPSQYDEVGLRQTAGVAGSYSGDVQSDRMPYVQVYLGGHIYQVTAAEADALTAAGYGAGIS